MPQQTIQLFPLLKNSKRIFSRYVLSSSKYYFPRGPKNNLYQWKKCRGTQEQHSKMCFFFSFFFQIWNPILFVRYSHIFCMESLHPKLITMTVIKLKYLHRFVSRQKKDKSEPEYQSGSIRKRNSSSEKSRNKKIRTVLNNLWDSIKNSGIVMIFFCNIQLNCWKKNEKRLFVVFTQLRHASKKCMKNWKGFNYLFKICFLYFKWFKWI